MADISLYKYLEAAFRHKVFTDKAAKSFKYLNYNLPYEGPKGIFEYARKVFPSFYSLHFPDTQEGHLQMAESILEKLDRHQDPDLNKYFDPVTAPAEYAVVAQEAQAVSQQTAGAGASSSTGNIPFSMPHAPTFSTPNIPRVVRNIPHAPEEPKSELVTANKSGYVAEKPPTEFHVTDKSGNITATYTKNPPTVSEAPKIITTNSSGVPTKGITTEKPKLVLTDSRGVPQTPHTPPSTIHLANKSGNIVGTHTVPTKGRLNFSFIKTKVGGGVTKIIGGGLNRVTPYLSKIFNKAINGLTRIAMPGIGGSGGGVGSRSFFRRFGGFGGGKGSSSIGSRSFVAKAKTRGGLVFAVGLLGFMFLVGGIAMIAPSPSPGSAAPDTNSPTVITSDISSCKFIRSGDSEKELVYQSPLLLSYIQEAANLTGIPPAVLAAFIRVETPSTVTKTDEEIKALSNTTACPRSTTGALGVMQIQPKDTKGHDETAVANGAKLIGKEYSELSKEDYCDVRKNIIMGAGFILKKMSYKTEAYPTTYGDGTKWDPIWTNNQEAINKMVNGYYGCIKYGSSDDENNPCSDPGRIYSYGDDVWNSVQNCKPSTPSITPVLSSCPVAGGKISEPSYQVDPVNGHCGKNYSYSCHCGTEGRRAKAIDVPTNGQNVVLPTINNQLTTWRLIEGPYPIAEGEGGGWGYTFLTVQGGDTYYLDMLHLNESATIISQEVYYLSGTPVATSAIAHVHITMGKNLKKPPVPKSETDCDPGWLPSDFMCQ